MEKVVFLGIKDTYAYKAKINVDEDTFRGISFYRIEPITFDLDDDMNNVKAYLWNTMSSDEVFEFCVDKYGLTHYMSLQEHFNLITKDKSTDIKDLLKGVRLFIDGMTMEHNGKMVFFKQRTVGCPSICDKSDDNNLSMCLVKTIYDGYYNEKLPKLYTSLLEKTSDKMSDSIVEDYRNAVRNSIDDSVRWL